MKIRKLYIRGFGKIEEFELELSKNINVIYGPNESGKSTIMAFIKAVLFGLKGGRADREGTAAELRRYRPWSNSSYGGYIGFEMDTPAAYRLDRDFDKSSVKLYDQDFNDITGLFSAARDGRGIAEKLLGINEGLFERTVYIRQLGTKIDTASSKELIDRISNICQSGYEDISYKKAHMALKEALKSQVGTERSFTRPLDMINRRLSELCLMQKKLREEEESQTAAQRELKRMASEIAVLAGIERLFTLAGEFLDARERLGLQERKAEEIRFLNDGTGLLRKNITRLTGDAAALEQEVVKTTREESRLEEDLERLNRTVSQEDLKSLGKRVKVFSIAGILTLAAAIGCALGSFVFELLPLYFTAIPSLAFITAGVFRAVQGKRLKKLEREQQELAGRERLLVQQLENIKKVRSSASNQLAGLSERLAIEKLQYEQQIKRLESIEPALRQQELEQLESRVDTLSMEIIRLLETLNADGTLPGGEAILAENILENPDEGRLRELNRLQEFYAGQLQQKRIEKAALELQVKNLSSTADTEAVEQEIYRLTQQKKALEQRGEALQLAMTTLEAAAREVRKKFLPIMNKAFSSTFSGLTSRKYAETKAGDNLNIMLSDPGSETLVPVPVLSNGTADQLYLALRVAISETVLKNNEQLPLILDEPFAQYDDIRTENALRLINELGRKQQVLIFTCKQREVEMISELTGGNACKICSLT